MTKLRADQIGTPAGAFFSNGLAAFGAPIRHPNRVFIGAGHTHGGQTDGNVSGGSWLQGFTVAGVEVVGWDYFEDIARVAVVSDFGIALSGVSRTSGGLDAIGLVGAVVNDGTSLASWGAYIDAVSANAAAGVTNAAEIDIVNLAGTTPMGGVTPYRVYQPRMAGGVILAGGSDASVFGRSYANDWAINIANNGGAFWTGINFRFDAIMRDGVADDTTSPGNTGYARAIAMAHDQGLSWYSRDPSGGVGSGTQAEVVRLYSSVDNSAVRWDAVFSDGSFAINERDGTGAALFQVIYRSDAAANIAVTAGGTGGSPAVESRGVATNITLTLAPKGTGWVNFGNIGNVQDFADDAAAAAGGLNIGAIYRTGSTLKVRAA